MRLVFFHSLITASLLLVRTVAAAQESTTPPEGLRDHTPSVHALVDARIVVSPDRTIEKGTLVIRDGVIEAVGADVQPPTDARVWNLAGKTIYPGLIDAYSPWSSDDATRAAAGLATTERAAAYWNQHITPQLRADRYWQNSAAANKRLRSSGVVARLVVPTAGIIRGTSTLATTGDGPGSQAILKDVVALHVQLTPYREGGRRSRDSDPNSPMGAYALVRQALLDAAWYAQAQQAYANGRNLPRPERSAALDVLQHYRGDGRLVIVDAHDEQYFLRADRLAREFGLNLIVRGSGQEYRRLDAIAATGRPVIVPVRLPKPPNVATAESAMNVSLEQLLHWDLAPENAARLEAAGVPFALCGYGLSEKDSLLKQTRKLVARGLSEGAALRALTTTPAKLFGVEDRLGTLERGKAAALLVTDGPLLAKKTKLLVTWVDGRRYEVASEPKTDLRGTWELKLPRASADGKPAGKPQTLKLRISGTPAKLAGTLLPAKKDGEETKLKQLDAQDGRVSLVVDGKPLGVEGLVRISGVVSSGEGEELSWLGTVAWPDGQTGSSSARRLKPYSPEDDKADDKADVKSDEKSHAKPAEEEDDAANEMDDDPAGKDAGKKKDDEQAAKSKQADKKDQEDDDQEKPDARPRRALYDVNYPLGAFGRSESPKRPGAVLFKGATVWTSGPAGVLKDASVLVVEGRVKAVGQDLSPPKDAVVIDCQGKHISPGIIDCHSHIATDGGINETGQAITAEVRIGDFIDAADVSIYRQLAGGVTAANILHGSANPIGGQNQVIKFRWGELPEALKMSEAPPGIKFALGENVKQSNWGERFTSRYPQTRMGVEQILLDEFQAAKDYRHRHDAWNRTHQGLPPRLDLELEAVAEVVEGKRWIHCHSYRQDEILGLIRLCDRFGVQIGTLQHILEGYKVASEMARHGAMGSSFSDWWAYKFEVFDAIPYNGALMHRAGIVVSFNSDDAELGRRLNTEAAKAVKYGDVEPAEALKFVTLNPARQLRIDQFVGSLEPGKQADLVVWNGSPLSSLSRCEQTWIDGRKYFDRQENLQRRDEERRMRAALIQRVLASGEAMLKPGEEDTNPDRQLWPRHDIFCAHGGHEHGHGYED